MTKVSAPSNIKYTYAQLESIWIKAGGNPNMAPLMAAIAEAESSGDPDAQNDSDNNGTQSSFGLWQISTGTHTPPSPNWNDPLVNAQLAIGKLNSQGLSAWGTYTSGAYKQYISNSTTPDNNWYTINGQPSSASTANSTAPADNTCLLHLNSIVGNTCFFSKTNARALIGGILMIGSLTLFTSGMIVIVTLGFRKTVPAAGALAKGPVGMVASAAMKVGSKPTPRPKTTKSVGGAPQPAKKTTAPVKAVTKKSTTPVGRHRGPSGESQDKQQGTGRHRGSAA